MHGLCIKRASRIRRKPLRSPALYPPCHPPPSLPASRPEEMRLPFDPAPKVSDEIRKTTCYMCACRCGIDVHMVDGRVKHIEGNRDHPVNRGVLCAKGAAGIMNHLSPARLRAPAPPHRPARLGRVQGDHLGRGARHRHQLARPDPRQAPGEARLLHRPRPVPVLHRLVGAAVRHPELRRPRRLLLGQHGRRRHLHPRRRRSGSSAPPTGSAPSSSSSSASPRTTTATRSRSASASSRNAAPASSRSTRSAPATPPSPTSGSASPPAPTASSSSA